MYGIICDKNENYGGGDVCFVGVSFVVSWNLIIFENNISVNNNVHIKTFGQIGIDLNGL